MKKVDMLILKVSQIKEKYSNSCAVGFDIHDFEKDNEYSKLVTVTINIFDNRIIEHTAYYQCIPNIIETTFKKFKIGHFFMLHYEEDNPEKEELIDMYVYIMNELVKKNNIIKFVCV